jgi:hypothetical protein
MSIAATQAVCVAGIAGIAGIVAITDKEVGKNWNIKSFFYSNSIFQAFDAKKIEADKEKNKTLSTIDHIKEGIFAGIQSFFRGFIIATVAYIAAARFLPTTNFIEEAPDFLGEVIVGPIIEEGIMRGIFQNGVGALQKLAAWAAPVEWKENRIFTWMTSASFRIAATQLVFASLHLTNLGYLSTAATIAQVAMIAFDATESILYETTGSLLAPTTAHIMHNFIGFTF